MTSMNSWAWMILLSQSSSIKSTSFYDTLHVWGRSLSEMLSRAFLGWSKEQFVLMQKSSPDTKILLEHALKTVCVELVGQSIEQNTPLMEFKVEGAILPSIPQILDLSRYFSSMQLCDIRESPFPHSEKNQRTAAHGRIGSFSSKFAKLQIKKKDHSPR